MKHLKQSLVLMLLSSSLCAWTFAQDLAVTQTKPHEDRAITTAVTNKSVATVGNKQQFSFDANFVTNGINSQSPGHGCNPNASAFTARQSLLIFDLKLKAQRAEEERRRLERAKQVRQDSEYILTGIDWRCFLDNALMINGTPLDYSEFTLQSVGELTVIKEAPVTGVTIEVPFYIYLQRDGTRVSLPPGGQYDSKQTKINLSDILEHAKAGDHLVIEAVNKEDGAVKRILKLLNSGC